jgi:hypothetical protein
MSHVIHIWDHYPLPADDEEAAELLYRLSDQTTPQNPKFIELAKRLKERFPDSPSESRVLVDFDDASGYDSYLDWPEGRPDGFTNEAVYSMAKSADIDVILPVLLEIADSLGLTVHDDGETYLPGGKVLTREGVKSLQEVMPSGDDSERLRSRGHVALLLAQGLKPFLEPQGFKKIRGSSSFVNQCQNADVEIHFFSRWTYFAEMTCKLSIKFNQAICDSYEFNLSRLVEQANLPLPRELEKSGNGYQIEFDNVSSLEAMTKITGDFLSRAVLPVMKECSSIEELDKHLNRLPPEESLFHFNSRRIRFSQIIIMYLAKNPDFDAIVEKWLEEVPEDMRDKRADLIDDLKAYG